MRIIIIVQALIILAASYYIYLLNQVKPETQTVNNAPVLVIPDTNNQVREGYTPPTENPPSDSSAAVSGHTDVGMEYPIMDEPDDLQVQ